MNKFIARLNIEHLSEALETATEPARRATLIDLLAEEKEKLRLALLTTPDVVVEEIEVDKA